MRTKNIFKTVALAMLMPAMLLTSACSNQDDVVNNTAENTVTNKGYALPVTVNVTRQGDGTRATYNESTRKLEFSAGDKLFVSDNDNSFEAGQFAGELTWQSGGTFSGTIYTQEEWTGTADELFTAASAEDNLRAILLPAGYESTGYFSISEGSPALYDDTVIPWGSNAFVASGTAKATGVEQLSFERASTYSSGIGFALAPGCAVLNFTISGLEAGEKTVTLYGTNPMSDFTVTGKVTPNTSGVATFAIGIPDGANIKEGSNNLIVGTHYFTLPGGTALTAGKIYNITRGTGALINLASVSENTVAQNGDILTGTLDANVKISIADGATVILNNVNINGTNDSEWAGITCLGDATIILSGTNTVKGFEESYPGIQAAADKTLTINGTGSLTASNNGWGAGIGGGYQIACGNIEIQGGTITATGGYNGAGIGSGATDEASCGSITISGGTVTATGGHNGPGIGSGGNEASCGDITISGGNVTAIAGTNAAAIGKPSDGTCTSVTITPGITSLTLTNTNDFVTGIVSNFINATTVNANTTPITTMLSTSVTDATITGGMTSAGFATSYDGDTKTWTITKK